MHTILLVTGIVLVAVGLAAELMIISNLAKWAEKYADRQLSEYGDNDIVADEKARDVLKKGLSKTTAILLAPCAPCVLGFILILISR